jgi:DNA repair exonuclease SbcCD ATPase subunit
MADAGGLGKIAAKIVVENVEANKGIKESSQALDLLNESAETATQTMMGLGDRMTISWKDGKTFTDVVRTTSSAIEENTEAVQQNVAALTEEEQANYARNTAARQVGVAKRQEMADAQRELAIRDMQKKAMYQELGAIEQLKIKIADLKMQRELLPPEAEKQIIRVTGEIEQLTMQLNQLQGKGGGGFSAFQHGLMQNERFLMRGTQGMMGMLFALNALNQLAGDSDKQGFNSWRQSIMGGGQAAMLATFALQPLMQAMGPGTLLATSIGIGGLVALVDHFTKVNEVAEKASKEGLADFAKTLESLSPEAKKQTRDDLKKMVDDLEKLAQSMSIVAPGETYEQNLRIKTAAEDRLKILRPLLRSAEDQLLIDKELVKLHAETDPILKKQLSEELKLKKEIKDLEQKKEAEDDPKKKQALVDQIDADKKRLEDINKSTRQRAEELEKENKKRAEEQKKRENESKRLAEEELRHIKTVQEAQVKMNKLVADARILATATAYEREKLKEDERHQTAIDHIYDEAVKLGQVPVGPGFKQGELLPGSQAESAIRSENQATAEKYREIEIGRMIQIQKLREEGRDQSIDDINKAYELQKELIEQTERDSELQKERLAALEREHENKIYDIRMRHVNELAQALDRAFGHSGSILISIIIEAIKMVVGLMKGGGGGGGAFGFLSSFLAFIPGIGPILSSGLGAVKSLFGGGGGGGDTGGPTLDSPIGGGDVAPSFGKAFSAPPIYSLPSVASSSGDTMTMGLARLHAAIQQQTQIIASKDQSIVLKGTLEGQTFLRENMDQYNTWAAERSQ